MSWRPHRAASCNGYNILFLVDEKDASVNKQTLSRIVISKYHEKDGKWIVSAKYNGDFLKILDIFLMAKESLDKAQYNFLEVLIKRIARKHEILSAKELELYLEKQSESEITNFGAF